VSNLRRGRVQLGGFSLHGLASVVPELSVLLAPYLFDSRAEVDFIMDNYLTEIFTELFEAQGIALLRWSEVGWNHVFCREPVAVPEDIRGRKIRASSAIGPQEFARRVGADNVPVSYAELITALQTGLLDCGQGGIGLYALSGAAQEAPHLALTYHIFDTGLVVANKTWLDGLTATQRAALLGSLEPVDVGRRKLRAALARLQSEKLDEFGVIASELDETQRAAWRDANTGSHAAVVAETGGRAAEVYALIQAGKRAFGERQAALAADALQNDLGIEHDQRRHGVGAAGRHAALAGREHVAGVAVGLVAAGAGVAPGLGLVGVPAAGRQREVAAQGGHVAHVHGPRR